MKKLLFLWCLIYFIQLLINNGSATSLNNLNEFLDIKSMNYSQIIEITNNTILDKTFFLEKSNIVFMYTSFSSKIIKIRTNNQTSILLDDEGGIFLKNSYLLIQNILIKISDHWQNSFFIYAENESNVTIEVE